MAFIPYKFASKEAQFDKTFFPGVKFGNSALIASANTKRILSNPINSAKSCRRSKRSFLILKNIVK